MKRSRSSSMNKMQTLRAYSTKPKNIVKKNVSHMGKVSRNIQYFKSILGFSRGYNKSYHNDQLNKDMQMTLQNIYRENKILNTNIESIHNNQNKEISHSERKDDNISSPLPSKMLITQQKQSIPKISLTHLDEYYNNLNNQSTERRSSTLTTKYSHNYTNIYNNLNSSYKPSSTLSEFNSHYNTSSGNEKQNAINFKTISNFSLKNPIHSNRKRPIDEIILPETSKNLKQKSKNNYVSVLTTDLSKGKQVQHSKLKKIPSLSLPHHNCKTQSLTSRPYNTPIYKLPENLHSVKTKLGILVKNLAKTSRDGIKNITNDQILSSLDKTKQSEYSQDIIEKIKIINNYIATIPKEKFRSEIVRHRKVYVIPDGTVVFNQETIAGQFMDIPTRRFLQFLKNKKECLEKFYEFLAEAQKVFRVTTPFKNIFLINGISISDLMEIPETDNVLYICK